MSHLTISVTVRAVVGLYVFAFVFEAVGIVLLVVESWEVRRRWRAFMSRPRRIVVGTPGELEQVMPARVVGGDRTVETRLTQLEDAMHAHKVDHLDMEAAAWRHANRVAAEAADRVQRQLSTELEGLVGYLIGREERPRWRPWWLGPTVLAVGLVAGTVGNLVSAAAA